MVVGRDFKSMLRTVFTAKLVISKTPVRTSTGCVPREGRDQPTMECEQSGLCTQRTLLWPHHLYTWDNICQFQSRLLCTYSCNCWDQNQIIVLYKPSQGGCVYNSVIIDAVDEPQKDFLFSSLKSNLKTSCFISWKAESVCISAYQSFSWQWASNLWFIPVI